LKNQLDLKDVENKSLRSQNKKANDKIDTLTKEFDEFK